MDPTRLLAGLLGGVFDTRPKAHSKVARLFGGSGGVGWNPRTLLSVGALGWAAYEIYRSRAGGIAQAGSPIVPGTVVVPSQPLSPPTLSPTLPPTLPPPLPASVRPRVLESSTSTDITPVRRLVGVLLAAARCDGELGEAEYGRLLAIARDAGGSALVGEELRNPTPIARLVGGIPEPRARQDLYRLAFGVVRCDEGVDAREREWLAELARGLELTSTTVTELENSVTHGIALS